MTLQEQCRKDKSTIIAMHALVEDCAAQAGLSLQGSLSEICQQAGVNRTQIYEKKVQLRQVLLNLVGNALKFQQEGVAPVVRVGAEIFINGGAHPSVADPNDVWCRISVSDNGIGFEQKYVDKIFNMFQRLHGRNEYEGTGIGLATCRKIVERHGGNITATSKPGEGATFVVCVPVKHANKE